MIDLDALEAKARAATPGRWNAQPFPWDDGSAGPQCFIEASGGNIADDIDPEDAAHTAAFDPPTALALIARIRELEAALAPFVVDQFNTMQEYWDATSEAARVCKEASDGS